MRSIETLQCVSMGTRLHMDTGGCGAPLHASVFVRQFCRHQLCPAYEQPPDSSQILQRIYVMASILWMQEADNPKMAGQYRCLAIACSLPVHECMMAYAGLMQQVWFAQARMRVGEGRLKRNRCALPLERANCR